MSEPNFWGVFMPIAGAAAVLIVILVIAAVLARRDGIREQSGE